MKRIEAVRNYVDQIFHQINSKEERRIARIHSYGVAQNCSLLSLKRGLNTELAYIIGLLHDIYLYRTGYQIYHAINGAEMVRVAFKYELKDLFTEEEMMLIRSAIYHHSDKTHVHDAYDELLKDADVLQHWLYDFTQENPVLPRLVALQKELSLPISTLSNTDTITKESIPSFSRDKMADTAEKLAGRQIKGAKYNPDFMKIIRYYPEPVALDELIHAWCAAFIYHCATRAGLEIPIRYEPTANTRFACVEAWLHWGEKNNFIHWIKDGFTPARGDIIIYKNIIPANSKPADTPWYDHIGIVLEANEDHLLVAEGNMDNRNISGIVSRDLHPEIGCFLRIPENYQYDGWKYDYKTNESRLQDYK